MKLGSETGSVMNHIHSRATRGQPEPVVGLPVTFLYWTDRAPGTIREVFTKGAYQYIACSADQYQRTDKNGFSEAQTYEYDTTDRGDRSYFRRKIADGPDARFNQCRKNAETGRFNKSQSGGIALGFREKYWDPCF